MTPTLSPNTQAILLLTAPLIAGRDTAESNLLTPGEYKRVARLLRDIQRQPADLISPDAEEILRECHPVIDQDRLRRLLGRGFLLSQVIERWQARAIWVVSRADADYPRRMKARLREDAPAVLYGCGDVALAETGGLAVVGSRHVDDELIDYTMSVGRFVAHAGRTVVSGGAKGIDQAAMRGALDAGGIACGVLADSLEKTTMNREHRNMLIDGRLALISPYDPNAGFNVGNAMQRNKLIYALSDACLVVSSDVNKGGTWNGAVEQLDKLLFVPVYVRSTGQSSAGLDALRRKGALPWPNPHDAGSLEAVFNVSPPMSVGSAQVSLFSDNDAREALNKVFELREPLPSTQPGGSSFAATGDIAGEPEPTSAEVLFSVVRESVRSLLKAPMKDADVAAALEVSVTQAKAWLQRLVDEGAIEKQKKSACYTVKQTHLFK